MRGAFITIEGVEGSGKTTQLERLAERLSRGGLPLVVSREPGGTVLGRELRTLLLTPRADGELWCPEAELLLFYADRAQHLASVVKPALAAGKVVLVDRFEDSSRAYQGARGVPEADLARLRDVVLKDFRPDLTLVLDLDPEAGLRRAGERNALRGGAFTETRYDQETLAFHREVRRRFLEIARTEPERVAVIPAGTTPEAVGEGLWARVSPFLASRGYRVL